MKAELFQPVMGDDLSVVNAARVSFSKVSDWEIGDCLQWGASECVSYERRLKQADINLINYLARGMSKSDWEKNIQSILNYGHLVDRTFNPDYISMYEGNVSEIVTSLMNMAKHWVPFTHNAISLRMEAPVPIRTQCFKHKMGFTESEESRRYIKSTPILYMPDEFHSIPDNVKQGAGEVHPESKKWLDIYKNRCAGAIVDYELMIADGVAPEEARFILPQGVEVHWIWTGNLASYARYYNQRTDPHAQLASQQLARDVGKIIAPYFPVSWHALTTSGRTE